MTKTTKPWRYLGIFIVALLTSAALHWGWHLFGENKSASDHVAQSGPVVSVCLPPFCDELSSVTPPERTPPTTVVPVPPSEAARRHVVMPTNFEALQYPRAEVQQGSTGFTNTNSTHQVCENKRTSITFPGYCRI